jgi:hypothetical protein
VKGSRSIIPAQIETVVIDTNRFANLGQIKRRYPLVLQIFSPQDLVLYENRSKICDGFASHEQQGAV